MAKKETKEMKDCNAIGDVCKIDGFKSTMVNVERKVFKTIAWTWTGSDSEPCHTKKEAMEIAKEEMFGNPKDNVTKASFYNSFSGNFMPCWEMGEEVPLDTKIGAAPIDEDYIDEEETDTEEITTEENAKRIMEIKDCNANINYRIIRDYLIKNGEGVYYVNYDGDVIVERSRLIRVDDILKVFTIRGKEVFVYSPTVKVTYFHKAGEIEGGHFEFTVDTETSVEGEYEDDDEIVDAFDVNERYARLFAKAIQNGDVLPLPIKKFDDGI